MADRSGRKKKEAEEETELIPPALSDEVIETVFQTLVRWHREATLDYAIRGGALLIRILFAGSVAAWHKRGPDDPSLRKLVARVEKAATPGLTPTGLYRSIEIYDLDCRVGVAGRPQLTFSHARAVIGLTDKQQEQMLGRAEANDWTSERLEKEVAKIRLRRGKGRRPMPRFVKTMNAFERLIADENSFADLDQLDQLSDADATRIADGAETVAAKCLAVAARLRSRA